MALLIRSNIFVACARGVIGTFLKMLLPSCPAIVCHCDQVARDFFKASTASSRKSREFVSVVKVQDGTSYCLALLEPLLEIGITNIESTLHKLPNGDIRVIQSPADDVMMRTPCGKAMHMANDRQLSALKFEGSIKVLEHLIGAHFHIGELIADADIESRNRRRGHQRLDAPVDMKGCWDTILQMMGGICASSLSNTGGRKSAVSGCLERALQTVGDIFAAPLAIADVHKSSSKGRSWR
jgi:hypothetical protein